jgi:hypothetical protein
MPAVRHDPRGLFLQQHALQGLSLRGLRLASAEPVDDNAAANRPKRTEEQHKALLAQLPDDVRSGPVLLVGDPDDGIVSLLQ